MSAPPSRPLLSVFTAAHEIGARIDPTYRSLQAQTCSDWEWVVVDDSRSPGTREHLAALSREAPEGRVRICEGSRSGSIGAAKALATAACRGEILVELDHSGEGDPAEGSGSGLIVALAQAGAICLALVVLAALAGAATLFGFGWAVVGAGALGYVTKTIGTPELVAAIEHVAGGDAYFSPRLAAFVLHEFSAPVAPAAPHESLQALTPREREVLHHPARGYSYKRIAARLGISARTVESHVGAVLRKLRLSSRHEVTHWATSRGLLEDERPAG